MINYLEKQKKLIYDEKKEDKMNFQNLGVPSHLVPDTALYCATVSQYVDTSFVVYPDTGEAPLCQQCEAKHILSNQNKALHQMGEQKKSTLNER